LTAQQTAIRVRAKAYEKLIPEPSEQALADKIELLFPQYAQPSDRPNDRISCDILHQEGTGFQERYWNSDLEFRSTQTGCMRYDRNQRAIKVAVTDTHHESGPDFLDHAEIPQPNLTSTRRHSRLPLLHPAC
jgi:hypothetical protein